MLTRDDVIRIAAEAGALRYTNRHLKDEPSHAFAIGMLERFAAAVYAAGAAAEREGQDRGATFRWVMAAYAAGAADEREACAQVCDAKHAIRSKDGFPREASTARALAKEIRQRAAYRDLTPQELAAAGRNAGFQMPANPPKMGEIPDCLRQCRCGPDGCADSACPGRVE